MKSPSTVVILAAEVAVYPCNYCGLLGRLGHPIRRSLPQSMMTNAKHEPSFAIRAIPDRTPLYHRLFRPSSPSNGLLVSGGGSCHT